MPILLPRIASAARLTLLEAGVLHELAQRAESRLGRAVPPGIWHGSAAALAALVRGEPAPRRLREAIGSLQQQGRLRTWRRAGQQGAYPILVDGLEITGPNGQRWFTAVAQTTDWRRPALIPAGQRPGPEGGEPMPDSTVSSRLFQELPDQLLQLYRRRRAGLAPAPALTPALGHQVLTTAAAFPGGPTAFLLDFQKAVNKAVRSRFLLGANRSGRPFGFAWLLDPDHLRKVLEGRYDDPPARVSPLRPVQASFQWEARTAPDPAPEPPPLPALPRAQEATAAWNGIREQLRCRMNPKSFASWISPLRAAGWDCATLVLDAPTADFARVLDRFAGDIPSSAPPLRLRLPA